MPTESSSTDRVVSHIRWVMTRSSSLKEALTRLEPVIAELRNPAPYAFAVLHILVNVPTLQQYSELYRSAHQFLVSDDEILQAYHKEYPTWMRPS